MANIGSRYTPTPISVALAPVQRMSALSPNDYMWLLQGPVSGSGSGSGFEAPSVPSIAGLPSMSDVTAIASNLGLMGVPGFGPIGMALSVLGSPATPSISIGKGLFGFLSSVVDDLSLALAPTAPTAPTSISNSEDTSLGTTSVGDLGFGDLGLGDTSDDSDDSANVGGESDDGANVGGED